MTSDLRNVLEFYTLEKNYNSMTEAAKNGLKMWEKEVVRSYLPKQAHILNIGCGMGREAFALYDMGYRITAVDISKPIIEKAVEFAYESERDIEFFKTNGLDLPFSDNQFDAIVIWNQTFGLLYGTENQMFVLNECKRVLKKDGILSFSAHEKDFEEKYYSRFVEGNKFWAYKDCYWELFSMEKLSDLANKSGFKVLCCKQGEIYRPEDGIIIHCVAQK